MAKILNNIFRILISLILILLGVCSAIFSTYATIIPISMSFRDITKTIMIGIFIIVQVSVFFLAMTKNYIAKETPQHYTLINRIANFLMLVSIFSTITFFGINRTNVLEHQKSIKDIYKIIPFLKALPCYDWLVGITVNIIFIWSVCIILDILAIKMPLIGFDIMMRIKEKINHTTTLSMLYTILTHKPKTWIETKYNSLAIENFNQESTGPKEKIFIKVFEQQQEVEKIEQQEIKQLEEPKEEQQEEIPLFQPKVLNIEKIEAYFREMIETSNNGISLGVRKIALRIGVNKGTADRIFEKLKDQQYIKTVGIQTKILKSEFDKSDFEGEE